MAAAEAWVQREDGATDAPADQEDLARREAAATAALAAATTLTAKSPAPVPVTGPVAAPYPAGSNGAQNRAGQGAYRMTATLGAQLSHPGTPRCRRGAVSSPRY